MKANLVKLSLWYVIAADEDSEIIYGHNAKSKEELRQLIEAGKWDDLLTKIPVKVVISSTYQVVQCTLLVKAS